MYKMESSEPLSRSASEANAPREFALRKAILTSGTVISSPVVPQQPDNSAVSLKGSINDANFSPRNSEDTAVSAIDQSLPSSDAKEGKSSMDLPPATAAVFRPLSAPFEEGNPSFLRLSGNHVPGPASSPTEPPKHVNRRSPLLPNFLRLSSSPKERPISQGSTVQGSSISAVSSRPTTPSDAGSLHEADQAHAVRHLKPKVIDTLPRSRLSFLVSKNVHSIDAPSEGERALTDDKGPSIKKADQVLGTRLASLYDLPAVDQPGEQLPRSTYQPNPPVSDGIDSSAQLLIHDHMSQIGTEADEDEARDTVDNLNHLTRPHTRPGVITKSGSDRLLSPLKSNPVLRRTVTAPSYPSAAARRVTIKPPDLTIKPEHRSIRQSIVTTPYPHYTPAVPAKNTTGLRQLGLARVVKQDSTLYLCVPASTITGRPRRTVITVPATPGSQFDDSHLFKLIRAEYSGLLNPFCRLFSARTLSSVSITGPKKAARSITSFDVEAFFRFFKKPVKGRKSKFWTDWVRSLPQNKPRSTLPSATSPNLSTFDDGEYDNDDEEEADEKGMRGSNSGGKVEVLFHHTFSFWRILLACLVVLLASVLVTVLWIVFGIGGWDSVRIAIPLEIEASPARLGYHAAGGRVEAGALLGVLTLLVGTVGIGGWVGLSALVV